MHTVTGSSFTQVGSGLIATTTVTLDDPTGVAVGQAVSAVGVQHGSVVASITGKILELDRALDGDFNLATLTFQPFVCMTSPGDPSKVCCVPHRSPA